MSSRTSHALRKAITQRLAMLVLVPLVLTGSLMSPLGPMRIVPAHAASWSGWSQVPGGGTTDVALASTAAFHLQLVLLSKGVNDDHMYMNAFNDVTWTGWSAVPGGGTTNAPLAATVYEGLLWIFAKGINDDHMYMNTFNGGSWSGWSQVPGGGTTDAAMSATTLGDQVYLFAKGINDDHIYVNRYG